MLPVVAKLLPSVAGRTAALPVRILGPVGKPGDDIEADFFKRLRYNDLFLTQEYSHTEVLMPLCDTEAG